MTDENAIRDAIERLKSTHKDTRSLYNAVCHLLFFEHGIAPTGRRLYDYVKRGSMSVPGEELAKFWEEVRSKGKVTVALPGIPDSVSRPASEAIAAIWLQATAAARAELDTAKREQERLSEEARAAQAAAEDAALLAQRTAEDLRVRLEEVNAALEASRDSLENERRSLAGAYGRINELLSQLDQARLQQDRMQEAFSADLALARQDAQTAQDRAAAAERRALMEIEQERQARARAEKRADSLQDRLSACESKERQLSLDLAEERTRAKMQLTAKDEALEHAASAHESLRLQHEAATQQLASSQHMLSNVQQALAASQAEAQTLKQLIERITQPIPSPTGALVKASSRKAKGP